MQNKPFPAGGQQPPSVSIDPAALALLEFVPDAMVISDPCGAIVFVNGQTEKMFGYSRGELLGKDLGILIPERFGANHHDPKSEFFLAPKAPLMNSNLELYGRNKNGAEFPVEISLSPYQTQDRTLAIAIVRDISERKRAADALNAKMKELADFKFALDEHAILAITDPQGLITYANDKFCTISQYTRGELLGQDHRMINSGYHSKEFWREAWSTVGSGKVWKGEVRNRAKDGSYYWVDATIVPFLDERKKPVQYLAIRTEITARKKIEAEREKLIEELQRLLAEVKTLSGLLPICCNCKNVRDDKGYWSQIEAYISNHTGAEFSHGYCPDCIKLFYEDAGVPIPDDL